MKKPDKFFLWLICFFLVVCFSSFATGAEGTRYAVQVSACRKQVSARAVVSKLIRKGYKPFISKMADGKGGLWYVVRIGQYLSLKEARAAARAYCLKEGKEAVVTRSDSLKVLAIAAPERLNTSGKMTKREPPTPPRPPGSSRTVQKKKPRENPKLRSEAKSPPAKPGVTTGARAVKVGSGAEEPSDQPTPPEVAEASSAKEPPPGETQKVKELERRIRNIEKELKELREEREARKKLQVTREEKEKKEKEILSAAGRQYTLLKKGTLGVEYNFTYAYYSYDVIREASHIEHHANHNLTNALYIEYALMDNLTFNSNLPFVYKYDRSGTSESKDVNDLGDVSLGVQWQPFKSGGALPAAILQATVTLPSGRSPYEIDPESELSTGSGYYTASAGVTFSRTVDPIVAFGSLSYDHNFDINSLDQKRSGGRVLTEVDPGDRINGSIGIGYALSYKVSLNLSYQYSYNFATTYHWKATQDTKRAAYSSSIFSIGTGWRITPTRSIYIKVGIGLTNDDPDFLFSIRVPFRFIM